MTSAFYSDAAEKIRVELTATELAAIEEARHTLEANPTQGRSLPDADPHSTSHVIELLPEQTNGRGISVVYRYSQQLDAVLILWLIAGP